jgi:ElaB/YqjD/DUF883 family membrane-anchored ribosome-binding protein
MARRGKRMTGEGQIEARLSALRQDLQALQEDMRGLGEGVGEAAQERLTEALRATEALAVQAQDWGNENLDTVRDSIRDQPVAACLVSMGIGALLGAILLRR